MAGDSLEKQTEEGLGLWDKVKGAVTRPLPDDYYETNLENTTGFLSRNKDKVPMSVKAASFMAEAMPVIGDAIAAKEVWDELQKAEPNYYLVGALGGATVVGLVPGLGDAAAKSIKKGAKEVFDVAKRVEVNPNAMGSMGGNIRLRPKSESNFTVTREDASSIFGEGSERVRYTDPESKSTMEVVVRPDGRASVLDLQVPEDFRGKGLGQSLQEQVMQDFPIMGGQVSSKAAATTAYRLGRRPVGQPSATLEDVFAEIDDMSSVNLVSPKLQPKPKVTPPRFDEGALRTAANQNDKSRDILVEMPIDDFLKSAEKGLVESKLENTRALVAEGTPFSSVPNLTFKNNGDGTAKVVGHEGRHRALALKEQGDTTMPVLLTSRGGDGPSIRWGQQNDPDSFDYVDVIPQRLIEEDGTGLVSMPSAAAEIRTKSGFAEGGLATNQGEMDQMDKMLEEGGLTTDGLNVDPVSGNDIPTGSNAEDVRDDIDAKLSEGEYVVPADVVKYIGVSTLEKMVTKAKDGLGAMADEGRIGGEPVADEAAREDILEYSLGSDVEALDGYASGGLVEGANVDGIIDRVKAAAVKDPSILNMLKAKGIFIQEPQPQGNAQQKAMSTGSVPAQAAPPSIQGQPTPKAFAEGGLAYTDPTYKSTNYASDFDPSAYVPGFSISGGANRQAESTTPVCPEGYKWDANLKVCMPVEQTGIESEEKAFDGRDDGGSNGPTTSWSDKYDYTDPKALFSQSMETLGSSEGEKKTGVGGFLENAMGNVAGLLGGGLLGKAMSASTVSAANANAQALSEMGRQDLADKLSAATSTYSTSKGLDKLPEGLINGSQRFEGIKDLIGKSKGTGTAKGTGTKATASSGTTKGTSSKGIVSYRGSPTEEAPESSSRPQARDQATTRSQASTSPGGFSSARSAVSKAGSVSRDTARSLSGAQMSAGSGVGSEDDGSNYAGPMNRGGLVSPRTKKKLKNKKTKK